MTLISELLSRKTELKKQIDAIDLVLKSLNYTDNQEVIESPKNLEYVNTHNDMVGFPENGTFLDKILYCIKKESRFLHVFEIASMLKPFVDKDIDDIKRRVSAVLSQAKSKGISKKLINIQYSNSKKDTVWGNKEWLLEGDRIKDEYMFHKKNNKSNSASLF